MKSWKTTLIGWATGGGYLFLTSIQGGMKPKDAALAVGLGILGTFAKDHNVSGQTGQTGIGGMKPPE